MAIVAVLALALAGFGAWYFAIGRPSDNDRVMKIDVMKRAAGRGNPRMQYEMGMLYFEGVRANRDYVGASEWLRKAADAKYVEAYYPLAYLYGTGQGVVAHLQDTEKYLRLAAEHGVPEGLYGLAALLEHGVRPPVGYRIEANPEESLLLYRKAADANLLEAQVAAGLMLARGNGVAVNIPEALQLLEPAARLGNPKAQHELGLLMESSDSPARDLRGAIRWQHKAAAAGYVPAVVRLARAYAEGGVVERNSDKAFWWWRLAQTLGAEEAKAQCEALSREVTSWQVARIESRLLTWTPEVREVKRSDEGKPRLPLI